MKYINLFILIILLSACSPKKQDHKTTTTKPLVSKQQNFTNKGHELVYNVTQKVGNYELLSSKKDVVYTYTYTTPKEQIDVSTEKYLFNGELSYGNYKQHQRTLPQLKGNIEQGFDGKNYWIKNNGNEITDSEILKRVAFNRPTNFYWFTMFQKLLDPGLIYNYLGEKNINGIAYKVVKISFNSNKPTDIYQIYINPNTQLIDQFLFTVVDFGLVETPMLMKVQYQKIDGLLIPTKRKYKKSTWEAFEDQKPWTNVVWSNIKFNNGLTSKDFLK